MEIGDLLDWFRNHGDDYNELGMATILAGAHAQCVQWGQRFSENGQVGSCSVHFEVGKTPYSQGRKIEVALHVERGGDGPQATPKDVFEFLRTQLKDKPGYAIKGSGPSFKVLSGDPIELDGYTTVEALAREVCARLHDLAIERGFDAYLHSVDVFWGNNQTLQGIEGFVAWTPRVE